MIRNVEDCARLRRGPAPVALNGTRSSVAPAFAPELPRTVTRTGSRPPRACASIERPAPLSWKNTSPAPVPAMYSLWVRAMTVRPAVIVAATRQGAGVGQLTGTAPKPLAGTQAEPP